MDFRSGTHPFFFSPVSIKNFFLPAAAAADFGIVLRCYCSLGESSYDRDSAENGHPPGTFPRLITEDVPD